MMLSPMDGLKARMLWLQARQTVVSSNIANANSPGFKPLDLKPFKPGEGDVGLGLVQTVSGYFVGSGNESGPERGRGARFETQPSGNAVTLEDEMTKLADIQIDYQMATTLYMKSLGLLKIAIGKK